MSGFLLWFYRAVHAVVVLTGLSALCLGVAFWAELDTFGRVLLLFTIPAGTFFACAALIAIKEGSERRVLIMKLLDHIEGEP